LATFEEVLGEKTKFAGLESGKYLHNKIGQRTNEGKKNEDIDPIGFSGFISMNDTDELDNTDYPIMLKKPLKHKPPQSNEFLGGIQGGAG
jgi:hypothetical protein